MVIDTIGFINLTVLYIQYCMLFFYLNQCDKFLLLFLLGLFLRVKMPCSIFLYDAFEFINQVKC
ncbi:hypothetical protein A3Q29_10100 [Providencia stuartii]|uniref:Uncharacterized protein n=1 Tax=Providencia stuartii TaxID=588 RepID=A0A1S1HLB8_PROST|nr:hypothetical protein A3Q29_10100 [Providencia stuartii]